jgi:hypothetical protein
VKKLVILLVIILLPLSLFAAVAPMGSGTITFKGYINAGIYFSVVPLSNDSYDLLEEDELFPGGFGLDVAKWTLRIDNPPYGGPLYYIEYDYEALYSSTTRDEIAFELIEKRSGMPNVVRQPNESSRIEISDDGVYNFESIIAVRYTSAGAEAARSAGAATDYEANIKVTLLSD